MRKMAMRERILNEAQRVEGEECRKPTKLVITSDALRTLRRDSLPGDWWYRDGDVKFLWLHVEEVPVEYVDDPRWKLVI